MNEPLIEIDLYWLDDRDGLDDGEPNETHNWYQAGPPIPQVGEALLRWRDPAFQRYLVVARHFLYHTEENRETVQICIFANPWGLM